MGGQGPTPRVPLEKGRLIAAELLVVGSALVGLAMTLGLVAAMYARRPGPEEGAIASLPERPDAPRPMLVAGPVSVPSASDPTPAVVATLEARARHEADGARAAERRAATVRLALRAAERARTTQERSIATMRRKARELEREAERLEVEGELKALERDVLARENDRKRADLDIAQARARSGYSIVPYKGPNGTWRVPLVVECSAGQLTLPPLGPSFSVVDLERDASGIRHFLVTLNRATAALAKLDTPDGARIAPYLLFVVRPDGIRPYYAAKGLIEPLGVAFGYELVSQETELDYPDLGDPATWPEASPLGGEPGTRTLASKPAILGAGDQDLMGPGVPTARGGSFGDDPEGSAAGRKPIHAGSAPDISGQRGPVVLERPGVGYVPRGAVLDELARSPSPKGRPDLGKPTREGGPGVLDELAPSQAPKGRPDLGRPAREGGRGETPSSATDELGTPGEPGAPRPFPMVPDVIVHELELVVVCSPDGLLIHPGAYRLSVKALETRPQRVVEDLRAIVEAERVRRPGVTLRPRLRFLVQPGGQAVFEKARGQTLIDGIEWPGTIQVASPDPIRLTRAGVEL